MTQAKNYNFATIAKIAKISIPQSQFASAEQHFVKVLNWIEKAKEVDASHFTPMQTVNAGQDRLYRSDDCTTSQKTKYTDPNLFANAPEAVDNFFLVNIVIE